MGKHICYPVEEWMRLSFANWHWYETKCAPVPNHKGDNIYLSAVGSTDQYFDWHPVSVWPINNACGAHSAIDLQIQIQMQKPVWPTNNACGAVCLLCASSRCNGTLTPWVLHSLAAGTPKLTWCLFGILILVPCLSVWHLIMTTRLWRIPILEECLYTDATFVCLCDNNSFLSP